MDVDGKTRDDPSPHDPRAAEGWPRGVALAAPKARGIDLELTGGSDLETLLVDLGTARRLSLRLKEAAGEAVRAGDLHAFGLVFAHQRRLLERLAGPEGRRFARALAWLTERFGPSRVEAMLAGYRASFVARPVSSADPAGAANRSADTGDEATEAAPNDESVLGGVMLLWLANTNPAAKPFRRLFDDRELETKAPYRDIVASLTTFFAQDGRDAGALVEALTEPVRLAPNAPADQLQAIFASRRLEPDEPDESDDGGLLKQRAAVLRALDVVREESKPGFSPGPPPPPAVPDFAALAPGSARYSGEAVWMRALVLVAKNVLVWLDQLARETGQAIERLDDIPDSELARLRHWGITGLWLIGIWRRSTASAKIKRLCGNPEAAASAYAVDEYTVDDALGGEAALERLAARAARHGIRLACDMVPNHMGIDSRWVIEHPDRFLQVDQPPFPGYSFDGGPDLSPSPDVRIHLEKGYYDRRDAAVVFRRFDIEKGETAYLYHGNDGTSLPWNDTAQLDFLQAETREAILRQIVRIARRFPIIRFDAAMTLACRHVQRLWHPLPGKGGDIPSRAEHALGQADFDDSMPEELWRQAVDRVAAEAPDTLLLAEAFWLMETYFVRSLGLHRVYNSAFMHMLRDQDNARFHRFVAEALAFDPALVAHFVSFATNPDESPAAEQLGTGDKAFAVATLLASMPGTPLFGHGQIEGLREKYGMEYRRAYRDERPEPGLVARHLREIAPLLARRAIFAAADAFELYTVDASEGAGAEVIALSNRCGAARGLVLVNNSARAVKGRLRTTVPRVRGDDETPIAWPIHRALGLSAEGKLAGRSLLDDRPIVLDGRGLAREGLRFALGPYERIVLIDLVDTALAGDQKSEGDPDPALARLLDPTTIDRMLDLRSLGDSPDAGHKGGDDAEPPVSKQPDPVIAALLASWSSAADIFGARAPSTTGLVSRLGSFTALRGSYDDTNTADENDVPRPPGHEDLATRARWAALLAWLLASALEGATSNKDSAARKGRHATSVFRSLLASLGADTHTVRQEAAAAALFLRRGDQLTQAASAHALLRSLDRDDDARILLGRNQHDGVDWFTQQGLRALGWWLITTARLSGDPLKRKNAARLIGDLARKEEPAAYRWQALLELVYVDA